MTLDPTQTIVKNKHGYSNSQMIGFKMIYDFISRFAFADHFDGEKYETFEIKLEDKYGNLNEVPKNTMDIVEKIGFDKINLFFSPQAYPKKFEDFCKKMYELRAQPSDYIEYGLLTYKRIYSKTVNYEG